MRLREFVKAPASHALKIRRPFLHRRGHSFCAGVTVYRALRPAKIQPGQLGVFGSAASVT